MRSIDRYPSADSRFHAPTFSCLPQHGLKRRRFPFLAILFQAACLLVLVLFTQS